MDTTPAIYVGMALVAGAVALVGLIIHRRKFYARSDANESLLDSIIEKQSPKPGRRPVSRLAPVAGRSGRGEIRLSVLEGHLRNAILDRSARERLVNAAMRATGGDRPAAIRRVLDDLHNEDKRFS